MGRNIVDFSRYVNRQYIFLLTGNLYDYGNGSGITGAFNKHFQSIQGRLNKKRGKKLQSKANQKLAMILKGLDNAKAALDLYNQIINGSLLESCMAEIASRIDKSMNSSGFDLNSALSGAYDFENIFSTGIPDAQKLAEFFNLIQRCLMEMQGNKSAGFAKELLRIGAAILSKASPIVTTVTEAELTTAEKIIIKELDKAAKILNAKGKVDSQTFRQIINNIFHQGICGKIARNLISQGVRGGLEEIESALVNHVFTGNIRVTGLKSLVNNKGRGFRRGSSGKVDLINTDAFQISISGGDKVFNITMTANGTNAQNLLQGRRNFLMKDTNTYIFSSNLGSVFNENFSSTLQYFGYNAFAHNVGFESFRRSVSASFLMSCLDKLDNQNKKDGLYFLVKGRLYTIGDIVGNVSDKILKNNNIVKIQNVGFINNKIGIKNNLAQAIIRSNKVKEIINSVTIGASLNINFLSQYL